MDNVLSVCVCWRPSPFRSAQSVYKRLIDVDAIILLRQKVKWFASLVLVSRSSHAYMYVIALCCDCVWALEERQTEDWGTGLYCFAWCLLEWSWLDCAGAGSGLVDRWCTLRYAMAIASLYECLWCEISDSKQATWIWMHKAKRNERDIMNCSQLF